MACPEYSLIDPCKESKPVRRYQIHGKSFAVGGDHLKVKDEMGQDIYIVRSKRLTVGHKLVIEDKNGNGLIKIHQELFHNHPTYTILSAREGESDQELATVKKKPKFFRDKFYIDSFYGQYCLDVDAQEHLLTLTKNGQIVVTASKKLVSFTDAYGIDIVDDEDQPFILALIIVLVPFI